MCSHLSFAVVPQLQRAAKTNHEHKLSNKLHSPATCGDVLPSAGEHHTQPE